MKTIVFSVLIFALALIIKPLTAPGFFSIHDDTQVARVYEMSKALKDGMFPVRWSQDLGYGFGYPIFNFYDPLPYYAGGFFEVLGLDSLTSVKLIVILGIIISSISMFVLAREFWGRLGGILSSILYTLAVYHAVDIYVRGDFAEATAFSTIPLVFYGLWKLYKEKKYKYFLLVSASFALIIVSHNLTALMVLPFIILFIIYLLSSSKNIKVNSIRLFSAVFFGILLSCFYWLPALSEIKYTNVLAQIGGGADFKDHFVCFSQLWSSPWGYGGSAKGCSDGLSFMIGKINITLSLITFAASLFFLYKKKFSKKFEKEKLTIIIVSFLGFLLSVFLTLEISKPLWDLFSVMAFIQYPWRFLILIIFFSSFISGAFIWFIEKTYGENNVTYLSTILIVGLTIFINVKYFNPQFILNKNSMDYINQYSLKWTSSKISDEYMPRDFDKPKSFEQTANFEKINTENIQVQSFDQKANKINMRLNVKKGGDYTFPLAYFPSWNAFLNGQKLPLSKNSHGILLNLPKGNYNLVFEFRQTPIEIISDLISITAILLLLGYNLKKYE